jgi:hypothetical protein
MRNYLRPTLSTAMVIFFASVLLFLGIFAEIFETQAPHVDMAQIYANPVPVAELQELKSLRMVNKHGNFLLVNTHPAGKLSGPWQMTEPQSLKVKADVIEKIVDALNVIRVRNFHHHEPINVTSFSLDNPNLTMTLTSIKDKSFEIKIGLINPIDNSAYLSLSSQNQIYQIDPIEMALESYDLAQLVESRVLALNAESLISLEFYGTRGLDLKLLKKEDQWVDQNGLILSELKVKKFFDRLEELKSFSIVDELNASQREFMDKVMSTPVMSLKLISGQGVRSYLLGEIKNGIPGMSLEKQHFYAFSTEDRRSFVLMDKDQLRALQIKSTELK